MPLVNSFSPTFSLEEEVEEIVATNKRRRAVYLSKASRMAGDPQTA